MSLTGGIRAQWERLRTRMGERKVVNAVIGLGLCSILAVGLIAPAKAAVETGPGVLPPKLEARYQHLTGELRCPVCQNEAIATSDSRIAAVLRHKVRQMLLAGKSNAQIKKYMVNRYGLFAEYDPPLQSNTWLLWFGPLMLLLIGFIILAGVVRQRRKQFLGHKTAGEIDR